MTAEDATAHLKPEAVGQIVVHFQDRVTQALAAEQRVHPAALHEWLRESITAVMEHSPASPSWGFVPTAMVARGRSPGKGKAKGKGKKGKPLAPEPQPEPQPTGSTTGAPEFYRISDPLGADTFLGSRCPELDADYREAMLLEGFRAEDEAYSPFPGGSSDDGAPGDYNVEELNDALEREAVEDAQRELDEALERARQQMEADEQQDSHTPADRVCIRPSEQVARQTCPRKRASPVGLSSPQSRQRTASTLLARTDGSGS